MSSVIRDELGTSTSLVDTSANRQRRMLLPDIQDPTMEATSVSSLCSFGCQRDGHSCDHRGTWQRGRFHYAGTRIGDVRRRPLHLCMVITSAEIIAKTIAYCPRLPFRITEPTSQPRHCSPQRQDSSGYTGSSDSTARIRPRSLLSRESPVKFIMRVL